ncbi:MAG: glutamine synthetase beta-grasp domain-containing protein [Defluviitaleaceae bacterium]|nr:glutamine synthetase beta-grasp domain-containing protein [Defluviitaleaceae bacterium]MCL2274050.1 glutamine synthetase beta-grasp domain-containing protein [Defluviitaleaceae bacterium]
MESTKNEILSFITEHDVKFVRLGFCDVYGNQKNIAILAEDLPNAFENGIEFNGALVKGFDANAHPLRLFPDAATLTVLPWRPFPGRTARFFCDIKNEDGTPYAKDSRAALKRLQTNALVGIDCTFRLYETNAEGAPTQKPIDEGGYLDIAPLDKGEDIRREICVTLEEMGIKIVTAFHGQHHGQNEITLQSADALTGADNYLVCKTVVQKIASRNGMYACFADGMYIRKNGQRLHQTEPNPYMAIKTCFA